MRNRRPHPPATTQSPGQPIKAALSPCPLIYVWPSGKPARPPPLHRLNQVQSRAPPPRSRSFATAPAPGTSSSSPINCTLRSVTARTQTRSPCPLLKQASPSTFSAPPPSRPTSAPASCLWPFKPEASTSRSIPSTLSPSLFPCSPARFPATTSFPCLNSLLSTASILRS